MTGKIVGRKIAINLEDYLIRGNTMLRTTNCANFKTIGARKNIYKNTFSPTTIPVYNQTTDADVAEIIAYWSSISLD